MPLPSPSPCRPARRRVAVLPVALLLVLAACRDATAPLPRDGAPAHLAVAVSGFGAPSVGVTLAGDTVVLHRVPWRWAGEPVEPADSVRRVPTADDWRAFWAAVDAAGVVRWRASYSAPEIVDGVGWSAEIVTRDRRLWSSGSNAYPDRAGRSHRAEPTAEFLAFLAALERLIGEPLHRP